MLFQAYIMNGSWRLQQLFDDIMFEMAPGAQLSTLGYPLSLKCDCCRVES